MRLPPFRMARSRMDRLLLLGVLSVLSLGAAAGSHAEPLPPACTPARAGQRTCMAEQACECRYERGGSMLSQPAGWRWSCSILTTCEPITPAGPRPRGLPDGMVYAPSQTTSSGGSAGDGTGSNSGNGNKPQSSGGQAPSAKSWATPYGAQGRTGLRNGGAYP